VSGAGEDRFARYDAAYLLGALEPEDRQEYVEHLRACATCRASVAGLAGLPGLLARVPPDLLAGLDGPARAEPPPATLLPALLGEVQQAARRRRRRAAVGAALGAVAAAVVAVLALGAVGALGRSASPGPTVAAAPTVTLAPVTATPIRATAQLVPVAWGTRILLRCTYTYSGSYGGTAETYALVVRDRSGAVQQVATWSAVPGRESDVQGATSWQPADITALEIRTAAGTSVLATMLSG
jgi:hypothetical protein